MKKALFIIIPLLVLALMEGVVWMVLKSPKEESPSTPKVAEQEVTVAPKQEEEPKQEEPKTEPAPVPNFSSSTPPSDTYGDGGSFPEPTTEEVNGRTERTIHMGVRQYAWEPATITAKKGELVRLIIHNADVKHGLVIPDLGVMEGDIPPEGAVIEFVASKAGTFEFFCSVYCGEGHMEMRGKIVIE